MRWLWVYLAALISAFSHILLDWTNNYGVRPFFPFNPRWYAGSFVFIAEPVLWILLGLALIVPGILGLAEREISSRRTPFRGRGWAIFALSGMFLLWCLRYAEHAQALGLVLNNPITTVPVDRIAAEPYPWNPFRWHAIVETQNYYQTAEVDTRTGDVDSDPQTDQLYKPPDTPAVEAAKQTELGKVYLDWGRWAVVQDVGQVEVRRHRSAQAYPRPHVDDRRVHRLEIRIRFSGKRKRPSALRPGRSRLHHRQSRRWRRRDGRARTEVKRIRCGVLAPQPWPKPASGRVPARYVPPCAHDHDAS